MPGTSYSGRHPPSADPALRAELERDVWRLAGEIGERNLEQYGALQKAADYIEAQLRETGASVSRHSYEVDGQRFDNIIGELPVENADGIVVIGAHYDSVIGGPGANDNASGVAAMLALARRFPQTRAERTVRFVAFVNEEPFFFQRPNMGSHVYARACRAAGEEVRAMVSLETIGYYSDEPKSQAYPVSWLRLIYPDEGNFIAVVGNLGSRGLVRRVMGTFRRHGTVPSEGAILPGVIPGVGWSDHWSFWQAGYRAVMITDTALFRYPWYHLREDTPDRLDYERMTRVVEGLGPVVEVLANGR